MITGWEYYASEGKYGEEARREAEKIREMRVKIFLIFSSVMFLLVLGMAALVCFIVFSKC